MGKKLDRRWCGCVAWTHLGNGGRAGDIPKEKGM